MPSQMIATQVAPNTIVQYKGGGYDGCSWEQNYAYYDGEGNFHNIAATGYRGCETEEQLIDYLEESDAQSGTLYLEYDLYCLDDEAERDRLGRETPISHLLGLARFFCRTDWPFEVNVKCDCCGKKVPVQGMIGENPHGIGGIVSEYGVILCTDCFSAYSCPYCGEWYGADYKGFDPDTGYCEGCTRDQPNG